MDRSEIKDIARKHGIDERLQSDGSLDLDAAAYAAFEEVAERAGASARENAAIASWSHFMDTCRAKRIAPAEVGEWCAAGAVRATASWENCGGR